MDGLNVEHKFRVWVTILGHTSLQNSKILITHTAVDARHFMSNIIINLLTDDILSRYEISRKLGEGGFGTVYEGKNLEDGLEVSSCSYNI